MKKLHKILLGTLVLVYAYGVKAQQKIDMASYGVANAKDVTPIVHKALKDVKGEAVLTFPKGIYHFYPEKAAGKFHSMTNHDNGYKYFAFPIDGFKNLTIDGQGSEFIFHDQIIPFLVENSHNITLKNFAIDWETPFYIQATVLASDSLKSSMTVEFTPWSKYKTEGKGIAITANKQYLPFLGEDMYFDPKTKAVSYKAQDYLIGWQADREVIAEKVPGKNGQFNITTRFEKRPPIVGQIGIYKGNFGYNRLCPAIHIIKSANVNAFDINVYHAGGMGLLAEKSTDIHLNRFNVKLRPGTDRLVTTTADATHFCNVKGKLLIENCLFENMLDDATNVHGTYVKAYEIKGREVLARLNHMQQTGYEFGQAGDTLQVVDGQTLLPKGKVVIEKVEYLNERLSKLTLTEDPASTLAEGDGLENITWYPELTFRNNIVQNNRARSILISVPKKVLIENNSFSSMMTAILFEGDMLDWYESGAVKDVTIKNNTFLDCGYGGGNYPVIWINPRQHKFLAEQPYEQNIRIENNIFKHFDRLLLKATSVNGLSFVNNTIEASDKYIPLKPNEADVDIKLSKDVKISGNKNKRKVKFLVKTDK